MVSNKVYSKIESKMNDIQKKKEKVADMIRENLNKAEEQYNQAKKHNVDNSDAETYFKAMESKDEAKRYINYYIDKLKLAESDAVFDDKELSANTEAIRAEQKKMTDKSFKMIVQLMNDVFSIYDELIDQVNYGNDLIGRMQAVCNKPSGIVVFDNDQYNFIKQFIGRTEVTVTNNMAYGEYFKDHKVSLH